MRSTIRWKSSPLSAVSGLCRWSGRRNVLRGEGCFQGLAISLHSFYLISDRLSEGHTILEQKWSYEDFCDVTIRLDDCTYALNRQVDVIALVRSFRPMPVEEFDRKARPLII